MKILNEFKEFAARGNVIDMAVGVVVGGAFGKIVSSFVEDVLMPPLSLLTGRVDLGNRFITLSGERYRSLAEAQAAGAVTVRYGEFLNEIISFLIIAFCIFLFVREVNRLKRTIIPKRAKEPTMRECPFCLSSVNVRAVRCPACTSELSPPAGRGK